MAEWLDSISTHWFWLSLGLILGVAEMVAPGFFLMWLGLAAIIVGVLDYFLPITVAYQVAMFATVLIVLGTFLILRSTNTLITAPVTGRGVVRRRITDAQGNTFAYSFHLWKGVVISTFVGFMGSLLGIGGGIIHVPVMATMLHFPVHVAAATSHFVLAFMAAEGTVAHFANGSLTWDRSLIQALLIGAGAIPGAQVGALLSRRLHGGVIIRALAAALVLVGVRLALQAISG